MRTIAGDNSAGSPVHEGDAQMAAPYFGLKGLGIAVLFTIALFWPMASAQGPLTYFDTAEYVDRGEKIIGVLIDDPGTSQGAGEGTGAASPAEGKTGTKVRSLPYSLYAFLAGATPLGLYMICLLQGVAVIWAFFALVPRVPEQSRVPVAIGVVLVGALSSLPWFVSYAMPDILGAILPIYYICLLGRMDALFAWQRWVLALLTTGTILSHYGNLPLAAFLALAVLGWRWRKGSLRIGVLLLAAGPVVAALSFNFVVGGVVADEPSAAPKRFPILLARSLEDGPARWYLDDACDTRDYAICDLFEHMPRDITAFLWAQDGYRTATDDQVEAIRAQENEILWEAFKRYPLEQTAALLGNAALQTVKIGTDNMWPANPAGGVLSPTSLGPPDIDRAKPTTIVLFDWIVPIATLMAAIACIVAIASGRIDRSWTRALFLLIAALVINAFIFGGLSAPVDRYQGRFAWLIPALLVLSIMRPAKKATPN